MNLVSCFDRLWGVGLGLVSLGWLFLTLRELGYISQQSNPSIQIIKGFPLGGQFPLAEITPEYFEQQVGLPYLVPRVGGDGNRAYGLFLLVGSRLASPTACANCRYILTQNVGVYT